MGRRSRFIKVHDTITFSLPCGKVYTFYFKNNKFTEDSIQLLEEIKTYAETRRSTSNQAQINNGQNTHQENGEFFRLLDDMSFSNDIRAATDEDQNQSGDNEFHFSDSDFTFDDFSDE